MQCAPPKQRRTVCPPKRGRAPANSYGDVVRHYRANYMENAREDLAFYAEQTSLSKAVELAAISRNRDDKRQSHQRRLSASTLRRAHAELDQLHLRACRSFDELFRTVDEAIGGIHGIGPLTVYDIACRIGAYLKLDPKRIYLHAGTRMGAGALGLGRGVDTLEISDLPRAFRRLTASEIEDCLCIYKDDLLRIASGLKRSKK